MKRNLKELPIELIGLKEAARQAGLKRVLIPRQNWQDSFSHVQGVGVIPVDELREVVKLAVVS